MKPIQLFHRLGRILFPILIAALVCAPTGVRAALIDVSIQGFAFSPPDITINMGDTVRWTQKDSGVIHTVTSGSNGTSDGKFGSGNLIPGGTSTFVFKFNNAGIFPYFCTPHSTFMNGSVTVNAGATAPAVALTSPQAGQTLQAPASVALNAAVTAGTSPVASVHFLVNGNDVGQATAAPYNFVVNNLAAGSYTFLARVVDTQGASADSGTVFATVVTPVSPSVGLTSPQAGGSLAAPASVNLHATPSAGSSPITSVRFFSNGNDMGAVSAPPYDFTVNNLPPGTYSFTARVFDSAGGTADSGAVNVTVTGAATAPTITLTSAQATNGVSAPGKVNLDAVVVVGSNPIQSVHFFQGGTDIGQVTTLPYTLVVSNLAAGTYSFTARVFDSLGAQADSGVISITVRGSSAAPAKFTGVEVAGLNLKLTWSDGAPPYLLEKKAGLADALWANVLTTSNTSAMVPRDGGAAFYRVSSGSGSSVQ